MFAIKTDLVLFLLVLRASDCDRRIKDGEVVAVDKRYVVYLVKAPISPRNYDSWLCGGALVSTEFIITSAACVEDVEYLYAIAGYKKYVTDEQIDTDPCTKSKKKKVIYTCTPVAYDLKYDKLEKWSYIDIALVKVESPYDFKDSTYEVQCSYIPTSIVINYEVKYQEAGNDAMVLGWGHKEIWRKPHDTTNYNQETLNYAATLIEDKETCKKQYEIYPNMTHVIDQYMICTIAQGNINDAGETILKSPPTAEGCSTDQQKLMGFEGISCEDGGDNGGDVLEDNTRRIVIKSNMTLNNSSIDIHSLNHTTLINSTSLSNQTKVMKSNTSLNHTKLMKSTSSLNETKVMKSTTSINETKVMKGTTSLNETKVMKGTTLLNHTNVMKSTSSLNHTKVMKSTSSFNQTKVMKSTTSSNETKVMKSTTLLNQTEVMNRATIINQTEIKNSTSMVNRTKGMNRVANRTSNTNDTSDKSRRHGICQNDHGGPLVTWVGSREVLIGIASVFKVSEASECIGPYLYTSTQCNGAFLHCVLTNSQELPLSQQGRRRRDLCDSPPSEKGYDTVERHISWMYHPAGPADNERKAANIKYAPGATNGKNEQNYGGDKDVNGDKYAASDQYSANNKPAARDKYKASDKYAPSNQYAARDTYAAADKYPAADKYAASDQYAASDKFTPEKYAASDQLRPEKYAASDQLRPEKYAASDQLRPDKYAASDQLRPEKYAASDQSRPEKYTAGDNFRPVKYPAGVNFRPEKYAANDKVRPEKYAANDQLRPEKYAASDNFRPVKYPAGDLSRPDKYAASDLLKPQKYAASDQLRPGKYAASDQLRPGKYTASDNFRPVKYPASDNFRTEKYPAGDNFKPENYLASNNFRPDKYTASDKFRPESYPASDKFRPEKYPASDKLGPEKNAASDKFGPEKYAALDKDAGDKFEGIEDIEAVLFGTNTNKQPRTKPDTFEGFDQYVANAGAPASGNGAKDDDDFVRRPQRPLHI